MVSYEDNHIGYHSIVRWFMTLLRQTIETGIDNLIEFYWIQFDCSTFANTTHTKLSIECTDNTQY
ncbi:hypothetical protein QR98_0093650 [Sarcoptes scabiei]|uniref:Uncharacterized protein n=1 Tax=Sarcoptes scabiei TaxID=52283 RepID=A0A132AII6_SARSC|nr:hypothetical protein QR98_0093650 [Sarcoptes scabiei]